MVTSEGMMIHSFNQIFLGFVSSTCTNSWDIEFYTVDSSCIKLYILVWALQITVLIAKKMCSGRHQQKQYITDKM